MSGGRITYLLLVVLGAVSVLTLMGTGVPIDLITPSLGSSSAAAKKPRGNTGFRMSSNRDGKAVFVARGVKPGAQGFGRVVITNSGRRQFRKVMLYQDAVRMGGMSRALQLQVFDRTTKQCLYPRQKVKRIQRRGRTKKFTMTPVQCRTWGSFNVGNQLRSSSILGRNGTTVWKTRERHELEVRWRLLSTSPNSDQGRKASFRLRWRALQ